MANQPAETSSEPPGKRARAEWVRVLAGFTRYLTVRGIAVLVTVAIGVYIAVWVSQLGGYADELRRKDIIGGVAMSFRGNEEYAAMSTSEKETYAERAYAAAIHAAGLDKPFYLRSFKHLAEALSLTLGEVTGPMVHFGSASARQLLLECLPTTLLLFATANLVTFLASLFVSLFLSRRYGSFLDRAVVFLVPVLAAPPWFHGILLILVFAVFAKILPYGGIVDAPLPQTAFGYALSVLKHMVLPVTAWVLGTLPLSVYVNRAFFLIHSTEDHVELAKAKGLPSGRIQRRYILRPVLPTVITNFASMLIVAWQGAILIELVFNWHGMGRLLFKAIGYFQVPIIIGAVVIFAYLLALTVLILDIVYALVDPRIKLGTRDRP